jgi:hypothetical protein
VEGVKRDKISPHADQNIQKQCQNQVVSRTYRLKNHRKRCFLHKSTKKDLPLDVFGEIHEF